MHKQIIILLILIVNLSYAQIPVYNGNQKIGNLHERVTQDCKDCYYWDSYKIFDKKIRIKLPAFEMGKDEENSDKTYFENEIDVEIKNINPNLKIVKFNSTSSGNSDWLYFQRKKNKIFIIKQLSYFNSIHKKKLKDDDYDSLPATEVCTKNLNIEYKSKISYSDFFNDKKNLICHQCPIYIKIEDCLNLKNKEYKW